jgi:LCP family protein required for cell wall assembly
VPANFFDELGGAGDGLPPLPPEFDPRGRHRGDGTPRVSVWSGVRLGSQVIAASLSMLLLVTFGLYWWKYHAFSAGLHRLHIFGGASAGKPSHDIDGKDQNILIVGNDDRESASDAELRQLGTGRDGGSLNTDTMMIVHVPANGSKATLISLPRDSYVDIPDHGQAKLNSAYPDGFTSAGGSTDAKRAAGAGLLLSTIQHLTGLTIDHFVQVDLLGFYRISNAIGGVRVNMCAAVKEPDSGIDLHQGINVIKGRQALAFVRQRYNFPDGNGDLDRVQRQRYFLTAAFRKLASAGVILNPVKLQHLLSAVQSSMYIDDRLNPTDLARQMENLSADNIVGRTIPTDGFGTTGDGQSIVLVNPAEVKTFVKHLIGPADKKLTDAKTVKPSSVTVDIVNAGGSSGTAARNAAVLRQAGFVVGTAGTAPRPSTATVIQYSPGMESQAKTVAAYVPGATLLSVAGLKHVRLVLGADHLDVKPTAQPTAQGSGTSAPSGTAPTSTASADTPGAPTTTTKPKPKAIDAGCIN